MIIGVIEWPSDAAEAPEVLLAPADPADLFWPIIDYLSKTIVDDGYSDDPDFIKENPYPTDPNDTTTMAKWLLEMREATTGPWIEFYETSSNFVPAEKLNVREILQDHASGS